MFGKEMMNEKMEYMNSGSKMNQGATGRKAEFLKRFNKKKSVKKK